MFRLPAPFVTNLYISWLTLLPPRSSLAGLLRCCLPGSKFFTFSSNKITLCFQAVTNFLVNSFGQLIKGTRADSSPLPELFEKLEPWYQQRHTCPHPLFQELRTHLSKSLLVLRSPVLKLKVLNFYLVGYSRYCPLSVERYCEVGGVERHWNIPTPWTEILNGTWLKDMRNICPIERHWGGLVERYQGNTTPWKALGSGALLEVTEEYQQFSQKTLRCSIVECMELILEST